MQQKPNVFILAMVVIVVSTAAMILHGRKKIDARAIEAVGTFDAFKACLDAKTDLSDTSVEECDKYFVEK